MNRISDPLHLRTQIVMEIMDRLNPRYGFFLVVLLSWSAWRVWKFILNPLFNPTEPKLLSYQFPCEEEPDPTPLATS